jgi:hypothetical protein
MEAGDIEADENYKSNLSNMQDPWSYLPDLCFLHVLSYLNYKELINSSMVSVGWKDVCNSNSLWVALCDEMWEDKVYVPQKFRKMRENGEAKQAFIFALKDSKRRFITADELCSFTWNFRFKAQAGEAWLMNDPWWSGLPATKVQFFPDGTLKTERAPGHTLNWKFTRCVEGREGPIGSFVRVNSFPAYFVSRFKKNWGFIMESCWVLYCSFPMPPMNTEPLLEDPNLEITVEKQRFEAYAYNNGIPLGPSIPSLLRYLLNLAGGDDEEEEEEGIDQTGTEERDTPILQREEPPFEDQDEEGNQSTNKKRKYED